MKRLTARKQIVGGDIALPFIGIMVRLLGRGATQVEDAVLHIHALVQKKVLIPSDSTRNYKIEIKYNSISILLPNEKLYIFPIYYTTICIYYKNKQLWTFGTVPALV